MPPVYSSSENTILKEIAHQNGGALSRNMQVVSTQTQSIGTICCMLPISRLTFCTSSLVMAPIASPSSQLTTPTNTPFDEQQPGGGECRKGVKYLVDAAPNMRTLPSEYIMPQPLIPSSVNAAPIPIVDLSGLDGAVERRMIAVQAISSACAEWGFFRIINHGIDISLMDEMLETVKGFFNLSWEEKMKYASDDVMNPVRYGTSLNTPKKHTLVWRDYLRHFGYPIHKSFHLWPNNPPNYRFIAKAYLEEVWKLALKIAEAISEGLGLERDYIEKSLGEGSQIVACNYYPPCPEPNRTLGLVGHSDHGGLTILMQNDVEGLQVKHDENWVAVPHVPGTFVVNIGDYLEILSNGRYKSVEHRAIVNAEKTRISVAAALGPEMMATVAPASPLVDEKSESKFRPIIYKDYMRYQQSTPLRGKSALQPIMTMANNSIAKPS
ncbi:hypothetical protein F0562_010912 [Nyssa sinensis]|uniref:Fe2OG dioxygenase domain-containing protein n=1 Tax=Nyssa sinensis TaxID=561372 RepID=A0A5J5A2F6_9ASTE|nr:hypothetical protein F0562_010912 [Nyssa sinensis]